jgi:hypothetical protein
MLKKIPKSDISVRPFKVHKQWQFTNSSSEIDVLEAEDLSVFSTTETTGNNLTFKKVSLYHQLKAQFYKDSEDNPFTRFGYKTNQYIENSDEWDRYFGSSAKVISIPQKYIGESIKKNSILINESGIEYVDDGNGNLYRNSGAGVYLTELNLQSGYLYFLDGASNVYSASTDNYTIDLETNIFTFDYDGTQYEIDVSISDLESGATIAVSIPFLTTLGTGAKCGNAFYEQGLIVFTKDADTFLLSDWNLTYKSTETIYEHEYLVVVSKDEFNVSTNPTSFVEVGKVETDWTVSDGMNPKFKPYTIKVQSNPGVRYIKKLGKNEVGQTIDYRYQSNVNTSSFGGFEQIEASSSMDITGSFLTPFITTIGLYDDDCQLVAVAKLPQPIKSLPNIDMNFIIRFDT